MSAPQPGTLSRAKIHELESLLRNTLGFEMGDGKPVKARLYVGELRELLRGYRATDPKAQALADALEMAAGDLHMLTKAVEAGDPRNEILFRIGDTKADIEKALAAWDAKP